MRNLLKVIAATAVLLLGQMAHAQFDVQVDLNCDVGQIPSNVGSASQSDPFGETLWCYVELDPDGPNPDAFNVSQWQATISIYEVRTFGEVLFAEETTGGWEGVANMVADPALYYIMDCNQGVNTYKAEIEVKLLSIYGWYSTVISTVDYLDYHAVPSYEYEPAPGERSCAPALPDGYQNIPELSVEQVDCEVGQWELMVSGVSGVQWEWQRKYYNNPWANLSATYVPYRTIFDSTGATHSYRARVVNSSGLRSDWSASVGAQNDVCYDEGPVPDPNPIPIDRQ